LPVVIVTYDPLLQCMLVVVEVGYANPNSRWAYMGTRPKAMHVPNTRLTGHQVPPYGRSGH
jgi:hypothetical protein